MVCRHTNGCGHKATWDLSWVTVLLPPGVGKTDQTLCDPLRPAADRRGRIQTCVDGLGRTGVWAQAPARPPGPGPAKQLLDTGDKRFKELDLLLPA